MIEKVKVIKDGFGLKVGNELVLNDSNDSFYYKSTDRDVSDNSTTETVFSITLKYDFVVSKLGEYFDTIEDENELTDNGYESALAELINDYRIRIKDLEQTVSQLQMQYFISRHGINATLFNLYR